ncbi:hypothetical protein QJS66_07980 [Kocuria rhizophila]|nr:hypothetical protein QJS66_07980 [Kocuria rhizophila]
MGQKMKTMEDTTKRPRLGEGAREGREVRAGKRPRGVGLPVRREHPSSGATGTKAPQAADTGVGPAVRLSLVIQQSSWRLAGIAGMDVSGWQPAVNWSARRRERRALRLRQGHRGHRLPFRGVQRPVHRFLRRGHEPRRLPLRAAQPASWRRAGRLLHQQRRRLVRRTAGPCRGCWTSSTTRTPRWATRATTRPRPDELVDPVLLRPLQAAHGTTARHLHHRRLAEHLHRDTAQFNNHPLHLASYGSPVPATCPTAGPATTCGSSRTAARSPVTPTCTAARGSSSSPWPSSANYQPLGGRPSGYTVSGGIGAVYKKDRRCRHAGPARSNERTQGTAGSTSSSP